MKIFLTICLFVFSCIMLEAQIANIDVALEKLIESYVENNEIEDFDFTTAFEKLELIQKNPYDLNKVTSAELSDLFFLNPIQISQIINHREKYGDYLRIEELQTVESLDQNTLKLIQYFVKVNEGDGDKYDLASYLEKGNSSLFLKYKRVLQDRAGYLPKTDGSTSYAGLPDHYFMRYRFDAGRKLRFGFTAEKDPGEEFFKGNNKAGFDFYSAFLNFDKPLPWIRTLSLGDYTMSFGQGLILHNDFGGGKSAYVIDIKRNGRTIKPYSSVNETNYFRGIASTFILNKSIDLTLFYSNKNIDGSIITDTLDNSDFERFSSIARDGFHRTESEIAKKGSINQVNYGGKLSYKYKNLKLGLNHLAYHFSTPLIAPEALYRAFVFRGQDLSNTSIDYSYGFRNFNFFGEISTSDNGGIAQTHGLLAGLNKKLDVAISYRKFDKDYQVLEANAFSEASMPINEEAIYMGIEARPSNLWKISAYTDLWTNPWLKYRVDAPSTGKEYLIRTEFTLKRKFNIYAQYRFEQKGINSSLNLEKIDPVVNITLHRFRLHLAHKVNKELELRSRAEFSIVDKDDAISKGYLLFQDVIYKPLGKPYSLSARYSLFDIDNFDSKIYTYENDILYEYAIPFFQNQGKRAYINFRYKVLRSLSWEFRYAVTQYDNINVISSGNEKIDGHTRSEIKTQIKFNF